MDSDPVSDSPLLSSASEGKTKAKAAASASVGIDALALTKNKQFQEVRKHLDQRQRLRRKEEQNKTKRQKVFDVDVVYVDHQRAAAAAFAHQTKTNLRANKLRDRLDSSLGATFDSLQYEIHILHGSQKLRCGDAAGALSYLSSAVSLAPDAIEAEAFLLRSHCLCQLGRYAEADADADAVIDAIKKYRADWQDGRSLEAADLAVAPRDAITMANNMTRALVCKAQSQYSQGCFEHALKYFHRAAFLRGDDATVRTGVHNAREAIENSVSARRGLSFEAMRHAIGHISTRERPEDGRHFDITFDVCACGGNSSSPSAGAVPANLDDDDDDPERDAHSFDLSAVPELAHLVEVREVAANERVDAPQERTRDAAKPDVHREAAAEDGVTWTCKQMLSELFADHQFLSRLLSTATADPAPIGIAASEENNPRTQIEKEVLCCASEALSYLEVRKEFWHQQKPVYARKREKQRATSAKRH